MSVSPHDRNSAGSISKIQMSPLAYLYLLSQDTLVACGNF